MAKRYDLSFFNKRNFTVEEEINGIKDFDACCFWKRILQGSSMTPVCGLSSYFIQSRGIVICDKVRVVLI